MKILIKPSDIVKRSLWRKYVDYAAINATEDELKKLLKEDEEFEINEEDALVIDLLKVLETPELSYKLNKIITDFLNQRSIKNNLDDKYYVNKKGLLKLIVTFTKNFPDYYDCDDENFAKGIVTLKKYSGKFIDKINSIDSITIKIHDISMECVPINSIKKMKNMFV